MYLQFFRAKAMGIVQKIIKVSQKISRIQELCECSGGIHKILQFNTVIVILRTILCH